MIRFFQIIAKSGLFVLVVIVIGSKAFNFIVNSYDARFALDMFGAFLWAFPIFGRSSLAIHCELMSIQIQYHFTSTAFHVL